MELDNCNEEKTKLENASQMIDKLSLKNNVSFEKIDVDMNPSNDTTRELFKIDQNATKNSRRKCEQSGSFIMCIKNPIIGFLLSISYVLLATLAIRDLVKFCKKSKKCQQKSAKSFKKIDILWKGNSTGPIILNKNPKNPMPTSIKNENQDVNISEITVEIHKKPEPCQEKATFKKIGDLKKSSSDVPKKPNLDTIKEVKE